MTYFIRYAELTLFLSAVLLPEKIIYPNTFMHYDSVAKIICIASHAKALNMLKHSVTPAVKAFSIPHLS